MIMPSILNNLLSLNLQNRTQACHALGGLVIGSTSLRGYSRSHWRIANDISAFLTSPSDNAKQTQEAPIIRTLRTTLNATDPIHPAQGPAWALCVLASFIVLMGPACYMDENILKTIAALLSISMRHRKNSVRALGCLVWRCVTWLYFHPRLELDFESDGTELDQAIIREHAEPQVGDLDEVKQWEERRERMWKVVISGGTGRRYWHGCDFWVPIPRHSPTSTSRKQWNVIGLMINKGGQTCGDAMELVGYQRSRKIHIPVSTTRKWRLVC
jgi:hypothetical protein